MGGSEVGKYGIFPALVFLYTKLRRVEVLDHYTRGQIHGYIIANPGDHYNNIKEELGLNNGSLAYHLKVLEREGYIVSQRDGMYRRFYPARARPPKERLSPMQRLVVEEIRKTEGCSQKDIARRLDISPQVVNYHVKMLAAAGIVNLEKDGRETLCYVEEGA